MHRAIPATLIILGIVCCGPSLAAGAAPPPPRPNVVLIITDDQSPFVWEYTGGYRSTEAFGYCDDEQVSSPEIDRLARDGLVFTRAYVSSSVCSPSRYATFTGRYGGRCTGPHFMRLHPPGTMTRVENNTELELDRPSLPTLLQAAGYRTGFVGKSHVVKHDVHNAPQSWERHGLQTYARDADPRDPAITARMQHNHAQWQRWIAAYGFDFVGHVYPANLRELYNEDLNVHNVEWTTAAALEFIDEAKAGEPFFLYYATTVPHGPAPWIRQKGKFVHGLDADPGMTGEGYITPEYEFMPTRAELLAHARQTGKPVASAWVHWFDAAVGALRTRLEEKGLWENTLFIVTSDHGAWRHGKTTLHEGGLRVPLVMHWPAGIRQPAEYAGLVQNIDYAPTILDLAGVTPPAEMQCDGVSLVPVLRGSDQPLRKFLFAELGYARGIVTDDWKYIAVRYTEDIEEKIAAGATFEGFEGRTIKQPYMTRNGHLGFHASSHNPHYFDRDQLYDLTADPREEQNLADIHPGRVRQMQAMLRDVLRTFENRPFGEFTE
jgi:arylsulfatase A-like enzyme